MFSKVELEWRVNILEHPSATFFLFWLKKPREEIVLAAIFTIF